MLYLLSVILLVLCGLTFWLWRRAIAQRERLERPLRGWRTPRPRSRKC